MEEWREIPNTDYSVSSEGRVASRKYGKWRVLKGGRDKYGYLTVGFGSGRGGQRTVRVHVLVAEAFLGPKPTPSHQVNHRNGVKSDNRADNFEWVTNRENARHARDVLGYRGKGIRGEAHGMTKLTESDVREIRRRLAAGESQTKLSAVFGVSRENIYCIAHRKSWAWLL